MPPEDIASVNSSRGSRLFDIEDLLNKDDGNSRVRSKRSELVVFGIKVSLTFGRRTHLYFKAVIPDRACDGRTVRSKIGFAQEFAVIAPNPPYLGIPFGPIDQLAVSAVIGIDRGSMPSWVHFFDGITIN